MDQASKTETKLNTRVATCIINYSQWSNTCKTLFRMTKWLHDYVMNKKKTCFRKKRGNLFCFDIVLNPGGYFMHIYRSFDGSNVISIREHLEDCSFSCINSFIVAYKYVSRFKLLNNICFYRSNTSKLVDGTFPLSKVHTLWIQKLLSLLWAYNTWMI